MKYGDISRLIYRIIQTFYNSHIHTIFLEGGFDRQGRFVHMPSQANP
jgi:hypothetical protein